MRTPRQTEARRGEKLGLLALGRMSCSSSSLTWLPDGYQATLVAEQTSVANAKAGKTAIGWHRSIGGGGGETNKILYRQLLYLAFSSRCQAVPSGCRRKTCGRARVVHEFDLGSGAQNLCCNTINHSSHKDRTHKTSTTKEGGGVLVVFNSLHVNFPVDFATLQV